VADAGVSGVPGVSYPPPRAALPLKRIRGALSGSATYGYRDLLFTSVNPPRRGGESPETPETPEMAGWPDGPLEWHAAARCAPQKKETDHDPE